MCAAGWLAGLLAVLTSLQYLLCFALLCFACLLFIAHVLQLPKTKPNPKPKKNSKSVVVVVVPLLRLLVQVSRRSMSS